MGMAGSYVPIANLSGLPLSYLQGWYTTACAELLLRTTTGRVQTGSAASQSYGLHVMSDQALIGLINTLADYLGYTEPMALSQPNFNNYGTPGASVYDTATGIPLI